VLPDLPSAHLAPPLAALLRLSAAGWGEEDGSDQDQVAEVVGGVVGVVAWHPGLLEGRGERGVRGMGGDIPLHRFDEVMEGRGAPPTQPSPCSGGEGGEGEDVVPDYQPYTEDSNVTSYELRADSRTLSSPEEEAPARPGHPCARCGALLTSRAALRAHRAEHAARRCALCRREFGSAQEREGHTCTGTPFSCGQCGKAFRRSHHLRDHLLVHAGLKQFGCEHCGKLFRQKSHLRTHVEEQHVADGGRGEECSECGKVFRTARRLVCHKNHSHGAERPRRQACNLCGKEFSRSKLRLHTMRQHENNLPFSCQHCGKAFVARYYVKRHIAQSHKALDVDTGLF
jgi:uncharacterized C2H2 Zn-finger protein